MLFVQRPQPRDPFGMSLRQIGSFPGIVLDVGQEQGNPRRGTRTRSGVAGIADQLPRPVPHRPVGAGAFPDLPVNWVCRVWAGL